MKQNLADEDRARGALLGLAVGDALGTTLEFKNLPAPAFPQLCDGPHREVLGGGPFRVKPGQVTDDTQMATALATSLRLLGRFDPDDVLGRYRQWLPHAFDVGNQTRAVLAAYAPGLGPFHPAKAYWDQNARRPAANGSLMRTAPIAVFYADAREARIRASLEDSRLTHADPRCALACVAFNGAIAAGVVGGASVDPEKLVGAAVSDLKVAGAQLGKMMPDAVREIGEAGRLVREDLELAAKPDPQLYGPEIHLNNQPGYVRVAFRLAFWELLHAPTLEAGLIDAVNRGGDADTNGAIVGALLGARYGEEAIPVSWKRTVLDAAPAEAVWRERYHPRQLLILATQPGR